LIHAIPEIPIRNQIPNAIGIFEIIKNGRVFKPSISNVYGIFEIPSNTAFLTVAFTVFSK
jgi:hypothetical protein